MRIAFISDTHHKRPLLPKADLLVHCGDLTGIGNIPAFAKEIEWLKSIRRNFPLGIIYVPGNHDLGLDQEVRSVILEMFISADIEVLINEGTVINGLKFYGSPMTPPFMNWAFMAPEIDLSIYWKCIPDDTEILITHGPAKYILDRCRDGNVGSSSLAEYLLHNLPQLKVHAFGHIHESHGHVDRGRYQAINASVLDGQYQGFNHIHIVDTSDWAISIWNHSKP